MAVETIINYFDLNNDRVFYPGTAGYQRRTFNTKPMIINDLRGREEDFTLDKNGFRVLKGHWSEKDVEDVPEHINNVVFPETIAAVKQAYVLDELKPMILAQAHICGRLGLARLMFFPSHISCADTWRVRCNSRRRV